MKHIILFFSLFFGWYFCVSASDFIDLQVDRTQISIEENILLEISVNASEINLQSVEFQIPGIENFDIFSRQQSERYQNINGEVSREILYTLSLTPVTEWVFSLWPIELVNTSEAFLDDEILSIQVSQESQLVIPEDSLWEQVNSEESTIKWLRIPEISLLSLLFLCLLFFVSFYIVLNLVFSSKKQKKVESLSKNREEDASEKIRKYFLGLEKKIGTLSSKDFFRRYNVWLREILFEAWYSSSKTDTLKELSKHTGMKNQWVYNILKKSYIHEFDEKNITQRTQQKFIDDILKILK